ncbi:hypothetical protein [Endozoicomonas sp. Mp262]|uniref:hypothetical protein n=1 Tax=Endozoicomonas sp. Mp262 TaxID=2919499 RepID=UPI0021DB34EA
MAAAFLEIVELSDGEIVLRRSDDEEPLLTLTFSEEAKSFLQGAHLEVAKVMFDAGINEVSRQGESQGNVAEVPEKRVLH